MTDIEYEERYTELPDAVTGSIRSFIESASNEPETLASMMGTLVEVLVDKGVLDFSDVRRMAASSRYEVYRLVNPPKEKPKPARWRYYTCRACGRQWGTQGTEYWQCPDCKSTTLMVTGGNY